MDNLAVTLYKDGKQFGDFESSNVESLRGAATWPDFKKAKPGATRVRHVRSGRTGTFVRWPKTQPGRNPGYAVIQWDLLRANGTRFATSVGRVVAYAFDLETIDA